MERRKRGECFNCGKRGHLARDCRSPQRHSEGNVATTKDVELSGCLSKEEWDAEAGITIEDDGAYFVEHLTASDTPSYDDEGVEEEEGDMEEGFSTEVRDPNLSNELLVFENVRDEDLEALSNDDEDVEYEEIEPLHQEDEETQENDKVIEGALVAYEDTQVHCAVKKTQEATKIGG